MTGPETPLPLGVWRRDRLPNGWRYWTEMMRRYSEPDRFRVQLVTAIDGIRWYPPQPAALPMWPGLGLVELLNSQRFGGVGGLGVSETPLEYPEDAYLDAYLERDAAPIWATYSLLGIKQITREGWQLSYFLDRGTDISGIALDIVDQPHPTDHSVYCVLNRHDECPGSYEPTGWLPGKRVSCGCECGCRSRSQGRGPDDLRDGLDHERQHFQPDGKGGTVTHDEPPKQQ
ncbi:hypothetical protein [Nocardia arizonensis]|uniref:hypothetical protein n=1 Tax=Nocardia arizonensis TaxID=1141647 RepID=UPI0006D27F03|nr:hypothetical protein [Nocardia arizonensis]